MLSEQDQQDQDQVSLLQTRSTLEVGEHRKLNASKDSSSPFLQHANSKEQPSPLSPSAKRASSANGSDESSSAVNLASTDYSLDMLGKAWHRFVGQESQYHASLLQTRRVPKSVLVGVSAVDFFLVLGVCWLFFTAWGASALTLSLRGIATGPNAYISLSGIAILVAYISLSVCHGFLQQRAGATGYSLISATIMICIGKFMVSFFMFLSKGNLRAGFSTLRAPGCQRFGKVPAFLLPMLPGGLLAGYDVLSFYSLAHVGPATYQVLLHTRAIFICFLWQMLFQRKLSKGQWLGILLLVAASITKGLDAAQISDSSSIVAGVLIVMIQIGMSSIASVLSEVLLKEMPMPTDLLNSCQYLWGLVWLVIALLCQQGPKGLYSELLSPVAWSKLQGDPWMISSICCLTVFGIVTAYLLKSFSNIVKEFSRGFVVIACTVLQVVLLGSSAVSTFGIIGVGLCVLGICVYSMDALHMQGDTKGVNEHPKADSKPAASL